MKDKGAILIVEDDPNDVFFLKHAFRTAGIENPVHVSSDGQEAIDYLTQAMRTAGAHGPLPCLVILDLKMPRKDGMEVLRWMRSQPGLRCVPVIVFSSSAQQVDVEKAYCAGANSFVVKPASVEKRLEFARHIKNYWLEFNELFDPLALIHKDS